jgi:hypothetical protein
MRTLEPKRQQGMGIAVLFFKLQYLRLHLRRCELRTLKRCSMQERSGLVADFQRSLLCGVFRQKMRVLHTTATPKCTNLLQTRG